MSDDSDDNLKKKKKSKRKHSKDVKKHKSKKKKRKHSSTCSDSDEPKKSKKHKKHKSSDKSRDKKKSIKKSSDESDKNGGATRSFRPMTKDEWDKKQSVVRRVFDEPSGRWRLIKGDGEVLEEIVSKEQHMKINQQATRGDGEYFQSQLGLKQ